FSIAATAVSLILAFGRFFSLNNFLFDVLPYYNKFRTPMMALTIAQITIPFFGLYGLNLLMNFEGDKIDILKKIFKTSGIAVLVLFALSGAILMMGADFKSPGDAKLKTSGWPLEKLYELRSGAAWKDLMRSLFFAAAAFGLVWYVVVKKQSKIIIWAGILVLILIDMVGVSKRYLSDENWEDKVVEQEISPTPKDAALMAVNKNHSRVFDLRYDPFNDAHSAPFHRNIGGYHPAKLSRYQDIISYCITPNGGQLSFDGLMKNNSLDMLNCAYILSASQDQKSEEVYQRPTALGNAWFASKVLHASSATDALQTINKFNPRTEVVVENKESIKPSADNYAVDSTASIAMVNYGLDTILYKVTNANKGLAVFSEVYYNEKNGGWHAYADGKELPVLRVNYILRGVELPAGTKEVKMVYNKKGNRYLGVEMASSGLLLLLLAGSIALALFKKDEETAANA
ncbi:MAG: hypothetical protein IT244_01690, partial [Bacteroidia bacterium]|nr:hypothetical protein [Bacteroidia bacterium]